jgi:tRNA 2-(methylsulfanyl)-N6-isopentenyladenosine37 hydroxylase
MDRVLQFLVNRTPAAWAWQAISELDTLLLDHATLELKAAHQAQQMIWKYGSARERLLADTRLRTKLVQSMSRLAREELRHFEQVIAILESRGIPYEPLRPCGYAGTLHDQIRSAEPERLIDTLIVGALIEARSCERFYLIQPLLRETEPELGKFYRSLLRSEARHFEDYLSLARTVGGQSAEHRLEQLRAFEGTLMFVPSSQLRFHSGVPAPGQRGAAR